MTEGSDESTEAPLTRDTAFERLRSRLGNLSDLAERLDGAEDDRERRSVLLAMITAGWAVRDYAADAYAALERGTDEDGIARGVIA